ASRARAPGRQARRRSCAESTRRARPRRVRATQCAPQFRDPEPSCASIIPCSCPSPCKCITYCVLRFALSPHHPGGHRGLALHAWVAPAHRLTLSPLGIDRLALSVVSLTTLNLTLLRRIVMSNMKNQRADIPVLIVGAGPTGLTLACDL